MKENNMKDIVERVNFTFANKAYRNYVDNSDKRWLDDDIQEIFDGIEEFLAKLIES